MLAAVFLSNLPEAIAATERGNAVLEACVRPGDVIPEQSRVGFVLSGSEATERELIGALQVGIERAFDQDLRLALRVLADIALRASRRP